MTFSIDDEKAVGVDKFLEASYAVQGCRRML